MGASIATLPTRRRSMRSTSSGRWSPNSRRGGREAGCSASAWRCPARSASNSMSFVGPTTHGRLERRRGSRAAGGGDRPAGLPRNRHGRGGAGRAALRARRQLFANSTISISASASAAPWCMTGPCCAAPGAMPARSGTCPSCPTASLAPAAIAAASSATSRSRRFAPAASGMSEARVGRREVAPIFRNAIVTIENLFDPETIVLGGLAPDELLERLARAAAAAAAQFRRGAARTARRRASCCPRGGQHSVLRGAAALAVSGVLSPRFGQMFAAERERAIATSCTARGLPHERTAARRWTTSPRTTAPSKR